MTKTRLIIFIFIPLIIFAVGWVFLSNYLSKESVTFTFKNSHEIEIKPALSGEGHSSSKQKVITTINTSGQPIKLKKGLSYTVTYKGDAGYENGQTTFKVPGDKTVDISPYFNKDKLSQLATTEAPLIQKSINDKYPKANQYIIKPGKLYHWGDWYGTVMEYTGGDLFNKDLLRVVLNKQNGQWVVSTDPPDITLSKYIFKNIPEDILRDTNNQ